MEFVRMLTGQEKETFQACYEYCKPFLGDGPHTEVYWLNLWLNGKFCTPTPFQDALHSWVLKELSSVYDNDPKFPERHILSYGFIINPAHSTKVQNFHCDYTYTSSNVFVTLTRATISNATQCLRTPLKRAQMDYMNNFGATVEDVMEHEGVCFMEVSQAVCAPGTVIKLPPHTPHRGISNGDDFDRVLFWICIDSVFHELQEVAVFKEILDQELFENYTDEAALVVLKGSYRASPAPVVVATPTVTVDREYIFGPRQSSNSRYLDEADDYVRPAVQRSTFVASSDSESVDPKTPAHDAVSSSDSESPDSASRSPAVSKGAPAAAPSSVSDSSFSKQEQQYPDAVVTESASK